MVTEMNIRRVMMRDRLYELLSIIYQNCYKWINSLLNKIYDKKRLIIIIHLSNSIKIFTTDDDENEKLKTPY